MFFLFMILGALLIVNMLIAMMGNTYLKVAETEKEWTRQVNEMNFSRRKILSISSLHFRKIFNRVSEVILDCCKFAFFHFMIGPENLHHFLNQSDSKLKPIATWSPAFSRASGSVLVFYFELSLSTVIFPLLWLAVMIALVLCYDNQSKSAPLIYSIWLTKMVFFFS